MATSGTFGFTMDIAEVVEEALEHVGGEATLADEAKSARRSINLLLQSWQNKGILLWTADTTTVSVSSSVTSYSLGSEKLDVLEAVINRSDNDLQLRRISMQEYLKLPRKGETGRPTQYSVRRGRDNVEVFLWPIPENSTDTLKLEVVSYMEDVNKAAGQNADISRRFLPALTTGTAFLMSLKRPGVPEERIARLEKNYSIALEDAMSEDRERASLLLRPKVSRR